MDSDRFSDALESLRNLGDDCRKDVLEYGYKSQIDLIRGTEDW